jgi:hypothetical protein
MLKGINLPQTTVQTRTDTPAMQGDPSLIAKLITGGKGAADLIDMFKKYFPKKSDGTDYDYDQIYKDLLKLGGG